MRFCWRFDRFSLLPSCSLFEFSNCTKKRFRPMRAGVLRHSVLPHRNSGLERADIVRFFARLIYEHSHFGRISEQALKGHQTPGRITTNAICGISPEGNQPTWAALSGREPLMCAVPRALPSATMGRAFQARLPGRLVLPKCPNSSASPEDSRSGRVERWGGPRRSGNGYFRNR